MTKQVFNKVAAANDNGSGPTAIMGGAAADILARAWKKQKLGKPSNDNPRDPDRELLRAAEHGEIGKVRYWLKMGADINCRHTNNDTPLIIAAREGHEEVVKYLLSRKTKPADIALWNNETQTALHVATRHGGTAIALFLIQSGAPGGGQDENGATPAFLAAQTGNDKVIEALAAARADIDTPDENGKTPLMQAIRFCQPEAAEALVTGGAALDTQDPEGMSALMLAIEAGSPGLAEGILAKQADIELKSKAGKSAMDLARAGGNIDLINAVERAEKRLHAERYDAFHTGTKSSLPAMKRLTLKPKGKS